MANEDTQVQESAVAQVKRMLDASAATVSSLLPEYMRNEADRFVLGAYAYFRGKPELHEVTPGSFIQCVVDSAKCGIPLDGRLGHAVAYNCKIKINGREVWEKRAQFQPDYKGIVAVAKRTNQILDIVADIVCENDEFDCGRDGNKSYLKHKPHLTSRGKVKGAYAIITRPDGEWRYEYMTIEQLDVIKNRTKSKDKDGVVFGPWKTDTEQMQVKTVVKRGMKMYCDDPTLIRALEHDDHEIEGEYIRQPSIARAALTQLTVGPPPQRSLPEATPAETFTRSQPVSEPEYDDAHHPVEKPQPKQQRQEAHDTSDQPGAIDFDKLRVQMATRFDMASNDGIAEINRVYDAYCGPEGNLPEALGRECYELCQKAKDRFNARQPGATQSSGSKAKPDARQKTLEGQG